MALYSRHHPTLLCPAFPTTSHRLLKALEKIRNLMKVERVSGSLLGEIEELLEVVAARDDYNAGVLLRIWLKQGKEKRLLARIFFF